ncbi:MAG TPA: maleylpyruvate isomerase family mycothiol-dependent enzyme [Marmoricola sp.]|nr:maleylpyruvate isomerase family mycothiol-dependent enzyme [Marmoricola sp.]
MPLDYLSHLRSDSARFLDTLRNAPAGAPVPSCPDWDADDLLWHLGQVQWFWGTVVADRLQSVDGLEEPGRPGSRQELVTFFEEQSDRLRRELAAADPSEEVYMWASEKNVGYIQRRQAHEALIHRLDAELVIGDVSPLDAELASDGVLEVLDVMFGGCPPWGTFTPSGDQVLVRVTDTGLEVPVALGRFTGTDPDGTSYDEDDISVSAASSAEPAAVVSGPADDLDAWLWHRRDDTGLTREGDRTVLDRFLAVLDQPLN